MSIYADKVFTIKKTITKDEFLRKVLYAFANSKLTPIDVLTDAIFGEVTEYEDEIAFIAFEGQVVYSGQLITLEKQTVFNEQTQRLEEKMVKVLTPYSNTEYVTISESVSLNNSDDYDLKAFLPGELNSLKEEDVLSMNRKILIDNSSLSNAQREADINSRLRVSWPSSQHEAESYQSLLSPSSASVYITPCYAVEMTYKDKKYIVTGFQFGNSIRTPNLTGNQIITASQITEAAKKRREQVTEARVKIMKWFSIIGIATGILSLIFFALIFNSIGDKNSNPTVFIVLFILFGLVAGGLLFPYFKMRKEKKEMLECINNEEKRLKEGLSNLQHITLIKVLKERNLAKEEDEFKGSTDEDVLNKCQDFVDTRKLLYVKPNSFLFKNQ